MEEKIIYEIKDVKVGDYAHYKGYERGLKVIKISKPFDGESLKVELPEDFFISLYMGDTEYLNDSAFLFATRGYDDLEQENQVPESDKITDINEVQVGDIAYYEGSEKGSIVVCVDPRDDNSRLKIETPEEFKSFYLYIDPSSVWLLDRYFKHAIRPTQNKCVEKSLPEVQEGQARVFATQSQTRIIYDGFPRGWSIEPFLDDERLLELLDPSQFPLKDITDEEKK